MSACVIIARLGGMAGRLLQHRESIIIGGRSNKFLRCRINWEFRPILVFGVISLPALLVYCEGNPSLWTMLRLKKQKEEEAAALAAAAQSLAAPMDVDGSGASADAKASEEGATAQPPGSAAASAAPAAQPKKISLLNSIGGKELPTAQDKEGGATTTKGKKRTPGEIRIQKDISDLDASISDSVTFPNPNDLTNFVVTVTPVSGFWAQCPYVFHFSIPANYPHEAPKILCKTKVYHPNIDTSGNICLNILRAEWKPVLDINSIINGLYFLFYEPEPNDPLNHKAAKHLREDRAGFGKAVDKTLKGGVVDGEEYKKLK